ncbi:MAG: ketoacyl-ACP synthase III [Bryobacterales bacterium]|nr:ketoacyl-ACP synthase III [Bryobacterales bacterium]
MAFLRAFGHYVPERVVANEELATRFGCAPEWILDMTGIEQRRYAAPDESVVSLGVSAAQACLERASMTARDVGLLIVSCGSAARRVPGPAALIARELGLRETPAFDVPVASAGSLQALVMADQLCQRFGHVLVVATEKISAILDASEHPAGTGVLFGDGAGACLVSPDAGFMRILSSVLHTDGTFAEDLRLELSGPIVMSGRTVIMQAVRKLPSVIVEALDACKRTVPEVAVFLLHQANLNLIARTAKSLDVAPARFFTNIGRYGNTSSASLLIAASEWSQTSAPAPGALSCFAVFGAGFHWGALVAEGG